MDPVLPHLRTWTTWNYIAYWVSDATNVAMWQLASSMLAIGLSWCVEYVLDIGCNLMPIVGDKH